MTQSDLNTMTNEDRRNKLILWIQKSMDSVRICSFGPSRSGNKVQAHLSYFDMDKCKRVNRSYAVSTLSAVSFTDASILSFDEFCREVFDFDLKIRISSVSGPIGIEFNKITSIIGEVYEKRTLQIRTDIMNGLRQISNLATIKRDEIQIEKARNNIRGWLIQGFRHGLTEEEVQKIFKESLIESILRI